MGLDDQLHRAGRSLVEASSAATSPADVRRLHSRRRVLRFGASAALVAVVSAAAIVTINGDESSSVQIVDTPSTTAPAMTDHEIGGGLGPTRLTASDGTSLGDLPDEQPSPGRDDVVAAVLRELTTDPSPGGAAAALAESGLATDIDSALIQLADAGLVVETTIDPTMQAAATAAVDGADVPDGASAVLVSIDPVSGAIRTVIGPAAYLDRPAGSAITPAVMAAAIESGVGIDDLLENPASLEIEILGGTPWEVFNFGATGTEPVTMAEALALGANTPWVGLLDDGRLTTDTFASTAQRLGLGTIDPEVPSSILGTFNVTSYELATMTSVFSTDGAPPDVHMIQRILTDSGEVIYDRTTTSRQPTKPAVDHDTLIAVRSAMEQVVCCGTGTSADLDTDVAQIGKTGTYSDLEGGWFTGSTPSATTVVWVGAIDREPGIRISPTLTGGGVPAEIWAAFTSNTITSGDSSEFPR